MKSEKMRNMRSLLDTSVHNVGKKRNIVESLVDFQKKGKQPFFDGAALPYAETRGVKAKLDDV